MLMDRYSRKQFIENEAMRPSVTFAADRVVLDYVWQPTYQGKERPFPGERCSRLGVRLRDDRVRRKGVRADYSATGTASR